MTIHPRDLIVDAARHEIEGACLDAFRKHGLTYAERLTILNGIMASSLKYALRAERHPEDPGRPSGVV